MEKTTSFRFVIIALISSVALTVIPDISNAQWQAIPKPDCADVHNIVRLEDTLISFTGIGDFYRSEDNGASWSLVPICRKQKQNATLEMYVAHDRFWMCNLNEDSLYRCDRDMGWIAVREMSSLGEYFHFHAMRDTVIFRTKNRLYISSDPTGMTWTSHMVGLPMPGRAMLGDYLSGGTRFLLCAIPDKGLYTRSQSSWWTQLSKPPGFSRIRSLTHTGTRFLVAVGDSGVCLESTDGIQWDTCASLASKHVFLLRSDGNITCAISTRGIHITTDGGATWTQPQLAEANVLVQDVSLDHGKIAVASLLHGVYNSSDAGVQWTRSHFGTFQVGSVLEHKGDLVVGLSSYYPEMYYRFSSGTWHWVPVPSDEDDTPSFRRMQSNGRRLFYSKWRLSGVGEPGIWISPDLGAHWQANDTLIDVWCHGFASTDNWTFVGDLELWRSSDDGDSWENIAVPMPAPSYIHWIRHIAATSAQLYVAGSCWIGHSTDNGLSWEADTTGLPGWEITGLAITDSTVLIHYDGTRIMIKQHDETVFRYDSLPGQPHSGWPNAVFSNGQDLFCFDQSGDIYRRNPVTGAWEHWIGTTLTGNDNTYLGIGADRIYVDGDSGIYSHVLSKTVGISEISPAAEISVHAWPQPVREVLHVQIEGSTPGSILTVYDILGRIKLCVVNPGRSVSLPMGEFRSGLYLLELRDTKSRVVKKIIR